MLIVESGVRTAKDALRAAVTRERLARSAADRRRAAQGLRDVFLELPQLRAAPRVGLYTSRPGEPGTAALRNALAGRGVCVVLPVITSSGTVRWLPDAMGVRDDGRRALRRRRPHPRSEPVFSDEDVVLVPALAVDTRGRRLGRGSDGYDRILAGIGPGVLVLAAVHDCEVLDAAVEPVPTEPHDVPVDAAITSARILYVSHAYGQHALDRQEPRRRAA